MRENRIKMPERRYPRVILPAIVAILILLFGSSCQTSGSAFVPDAGDAGACGEGGLPNVTQTCNDTIAAFARAKLRCGSDYDAAYDEELDAATGGSCTNVTGIRDETQLCFECLPTLETIPCTDVATDNLPQSCVQQLQRPSP